VGDRRYRRHRIPFMGWNTNICAMMLASCWCVFSLLMVSSPIASAGDQPVVRSIRVVEANAFSERDIRGWMILRSGERYAIERLQSDLRTITQHYQAEGYLGATAILAGESVSDDSAWIDLTLRCDEGSRTVIGGFALNGATALPSDELLELLESKPGNPLLPSLLEQDLDAVLQRYEKIGYPFAECRVESLHTIRGSTCDSAFVSLSITEGVRVSIEEVRVEGNRETSAEVIVREARIKTGELYDPARITAIRQRLQRLNIFSAVEEPELYLRQQKGGLLLRVREGGANTFDGVAGYVPAASGSESGYVTGLVSISMRNLFGSARKLRLRWLKEDRLSQELNLGYSEPWVAGFPLNMSVEFDQRRQDTTYVRQALRLRGDLLLSEELSVGLVFSSESVIPSSDQMAIITPRSSTLMIGADLVYDTRDDLYSPTSGARYQADYHAGRKRVSTPMPGTATTDATVQRASVNCEYFFSLFPRQVLALGVHARQVESGQVDESELYRLGGAQSLRGFREGQFLGSRIAWTAAEYRLLLGRRSFVFGFFDTGYYYRPGRDDRQIPSSEALQYGYGLGLRFDTPLGNMGVSFALGKGDSFGSTKVHVGIINEF
jgi:outer membrane protein insertion porin family